MRRAFRTVLRKELRDAMRDRRTALMVLVASVLTGPVTQKPSVTSRRPARSPG